MRAIFTQFYKLLDNKRNSPLIWVIISLFVTVFLLPYSIFNNLLTHFPNYGSFALVPLCLAAYLRSYRGAFIVWGSITLGIAFSLLLKIGLNWSGDIINNFITGNGFGLLICLTIARFFQMHRQIVAVKLDAQAKE